MTPIIIVATYLKGRGEWHVHRPGSGGNGDYLTDQDLQTAIAKWVKDWAELGDTERRILDAILVSFGEDGDCSDTADLMGLN